MSFQDSKNKRLNIEKNGMSPDEPLVMYRTMETHFISNRGGGLAVRQKGDLAVHRQQYFVYMIFDDQLVKNLHHPKVMHNQD